MRLGARTFIALVGGALVTAAAACQLVVPLAAAPTEATDAAPDGPEGPARIASLVSCTDPNDVPAPTEGQGGAMTIDLAFSTISTSPDAGPGLCPTPGVNLDGLTTCLGEDGGQVSPTCPPDKPHCRWGPACSKQTRPGDVSCDDVGGVDNAFSAVLRRSPFAVIPKFDARQVDPNVVLRTGVANVLIRLSGYNGTPNDPDVTVAFFVSSGVDETTTPMLPKEFDGGPEYLRVRWDGESRRTWFIDPTSLAEPTARIPRYSTSGFVRDGVLVVTATTMVVPFGLSLVISDARMVADLRRAGDDWILRNGMVGGRISIADLVHALDPLQFFLGESLTSVCDSELLRGQLLKLFCQAADLSSDGGACDVLSVGLTFRAVPADLGPVRKPQLNPVRGSCPDAAVDCEGLQ